MAEVIEFLYAQHWPVWAAVVNGRIHKCCLTEKEAISVAARLNKNATASDSGRCKKQNRGEK